MKNVNSGTCDEIAVLQFFFECAGNLRKPREINGREGVQNVRSDIRVLRLEWLQWFWLIVSFYHGPETYAAEPVRRSSGVNGISVDHSIGEDLFNHACRSQTLK